MKIEVGRFYKSRDGHKVQVVCDMNDSDYPFIAKFFDDDGDWTDEITGDGKQWKHHHVSDGDLVAEWVDGFKREFYVTDETLYNLKSGTTLRPNFSEEQTEKSTHKIRLVYGD